MNTTLDPHAAITRLENPVMATGVKLEMVTTPMSLVSYPVPCIASPSPMASRASPRRVYLEHGDIADDPGRVGRLTDGWVPNRCM
tara:strand:- start:876 stop:1130 length:255 start_codon:yes stop_codon:yes gene_type:complete